LVAHIERYPLVANIEWTVGLVEVVAQRQQACYWDRYTQDSSPGFALRNWSWSQPPEYYLDTASVVVVVAVDTILVERQAAVVAVEGILLEPLNNQWNRHCW